MHDFLNQVWLDNPVISYLVVAGIILFVWLLKKFISRYLASLIYKVVHKVWKDVDKPSFINLVVNPLGNFLLILIAIISLYKLTFPSRLNVDVYKYTSREVVHSIGTIILIVSFIGLMLRIIDFIAMILEKRANLTPDQTDNQLIVFFKDFFKVILVVIGILMIIRFALELNVSSLLTGLSIVGAAIALALRESIENLISSFIIFFDKPFTTGDLVKVNNVTGTVERIGLRSTRIRTEQKTYVTVPNKQMVDSILDNLSLRTERRGDLKLELGIDTPSAKLEQLVADIRKKMEEHGVDNASVFVSEITSNSVIVQGEYYTSPVTIREFNRVRQEINLDCLRLLEKAELETAGAKTDIRISGDLGDVNAKKQH